MSIFIFFNSNFKKINVTSVDYKKFEGKDVVLVEVNSYENENKVCNFGLFLGDIKTLEKNVTINPGLNEFNFSLILPDGKNKVGIDVNC